jgi:NitT/TauT family transport system substrate-binding protein
VSSRLRSAAPAALLALSLLAACGGSEEASGDSDGGVQTIRVASLTPTVFTVGLPHFVAEERGFYADAGIAVETVFTDGGGANVQAVASGNADIATQTGTSAVLSAVSNGAELTIISSGFRGIDGLWLAEPDSGFAELEDLAGQKVGFTSPGSSSEVAVRAFSAELESDGLDPIEGAAVGGTPDQLTAMSTGQIAAAYTNPPVAMDLVLSGEQVVALNGFEDLPGYSEVSTRVAFASSAFTEENPEAVDAWLAAMEKTWDWIFENPEEAAAIWIEAAELELTSEEVTATFEYYDRELLALFPVAGMEKSVEDAVSFGALDEPLSAEQLESLVRAEP